MSFEYTTKILKEIPGLYGAIVVNFESKELLIKPVGNLLPMNDIVESTCDTVRYQKQMIMDLDCHDIVENMISLTANHTIIHYLVPHFDNVLIFIVVRRNSPLPIVLRSLEQAGDAMRGF
ncbi:hypothetical protein [Wielerella bovis]|uniref:hypothetical protein n=1 Tax=Wielerella bovis TaxID=2917790 RepID=UPI0020194800|nr:hypothetical protein [Wielerella bovis]ULJ65084.1 hypothetical protein MIS33_01965 [Wielerella bovis]ULJ67358.1 hypothetical protein MIS31_01975 [Wielerella bovis]